MGSTPAKHSTRQITEVFERIAYLTELGIDQSLGEINNVLVRRYARRLAARSPSVNARIKEPATPDMRTSNMSVVMAVMC